MKRLISAALTMLSSRALPPVVCGIFLLVYIGIAFGTDDTLIALMDFTRKSVILAILLALIPLNSLCRILIETDLHLKRRRVMTGKISDAPADLFDEAVDVSASPAFAELPGRLENMGYKCQHTETMLAAWRGISIFPIRLLFLTAVFCLFSGILVSLTSRSSHRMNVIEGEPIPTAKGGGGLVERISLVGSSGLILDKRLIIEVAPSAAGDERKIFGLYPPSLYRGYFVYPRYLGFASVISFSAPDLQPTYENRSALNIYPPGKEERLEIPGSPYRIVFSVAKPVDASDPYMTGQITLLFKVLKGQEILFSGSAPAGGEFVRDGYRVALPDFRRMVITDFIQDYGVLLVWWASLLFLVAVCLWVPIRLFMPRREIFFISTPELIHACSRSEGGSGKHGGVFHETLDLLEVRSPSSQ